MLKSFLLSPSELEPMQLRTPSGGGAGSFSPRKIPGLRQYKSSCRKKILRFENFDICTVKYNTELCQNESCSQGSLWFLKFLTRFFMVLVERNREILEFIKRLLPKYERLEPL